MKYIKLYEDHNKKVEIISLCGRWNISNFTINDDFSIDVQGDVFFGSPIDGGELPLTFNIINGNFFCAATGLTTLKGSPRIVNGYYDCSTNKLESLEFSPNYIGTDLLCHNCGLTDLKHFPEHIGGDIICSYNKLTSLENIQSIIDGKLDCRGNDITTLVGGPTEVNTFNLSKNINLKTTLGFPKKMALMYEIKNTAIPKVIQYLDWEDFFIVVNNQEDYKIWNTDLTLNTSRFNILLDDIKKGIFK